MHELILSSFNAPMATGRGVEMRTEGMESMTTTDATEGTRHGQETNNLPRSVARVVMVA